MGTSCRLSVLPSVDAGVGGSSLGRRQAGLKTLDHPESMCRCSPEILAATPRAGRAEVSPQAFALGVDVLSERDVDERLTAVAAGCINGSSPI